MSLYFVFWKKFCLFQFPSRVNCCLLAKKIKLFDSTHNIKILWQQPYGILYPLEINICKETDTYFTFFNSLTNRLVRASGVLGGIASISVFYISLFISKELFGVFVSLCNVCHQHTAKIGYKSNRPQKTAEGSQDMMTCKQQRSVVNVLQTEVKKNSTTFLKRYCNTKENWILSLLIFTDDHSSKIRFFCLIKWPS